VKASSDAPEAKRTFEGLPLVTADGHTRASTGIGPRGGPEDRGSSNDQRSSRERSGADAHGGDPHRALVERVQREVPYATTAFSELVDTLGSSVFARARRILGSSEDAEDALQEVFLRVFRSIAEFRFDRPFVHWLQVITLNTCRQALRTRRREQRRRDALEIEPLPPASQPVLDPVLRRILGDLLDGLEPDTRVCIVLRLIEDRSYAEIAADLDVKEATVRKRVQRGAQRLRRLYAERVRRDSET